jgi:hypothetical protein
MRGINYKTLTSRWKEIIEKLCEEVTPHDVLSIVADHLEKSANLSDRLSIKSTHIREALQHIQMAMKKIDPELK